MERKDVSDNSLMSGSLGRRAATATEDLTHGIERR
jgi:hypothetical protein